jgi:hypothetical protein
VANENLKAVWGIEIGTNFWGQSVSSGGTNNVGRSSGFGPDGDGVNIETKWAYLDFNVPGSTVNAKVGLQPLIMPSAFNGTSSILDVDAPAVVLSTPINDMVAVAGGWVRAVDTRTGSTAIAGNAWDATGTRQHDETDIVFAAIPITPKGLSITPFGMYALVGRDALGTTQGFANGGLALPGTATGTADSAKAWWAGVAFEMTMFEPFAVYADFNYGKADYANLSRRGWLADAMIQYKGLPFGTPTLFGMYSTGENGDAADNTSERMPFIQSLWGPSGSFFYTGTTFDSWQADIGGGNPSGNTAGTWTAGAAIYGMTFVDKLTHDLMVLYISGTNDRDSVNILNATQNAIGFGYALTTKDHLWEVDFNHQYQIYEQLSAIVELGYIKPDFDENVWGISGTSDAWRVMAGFKYKF